MRISRIQDNQHIGKTFLLETVPSDFHFSSYQHESVKTWFNSDSNFAAIHSSDSNSPSETLPQTALFA